MLLGEMEINKMIISNKMKFIEEVRNHGIAMIDEGFKEKLTEKGYNKIKDDDEFHHLLNIPMCDFSKSSIQELKQAMESLTQEQDKLKLRTPDELWIQDLMELKEELDKVVDNAPGDLSQERDGSSRGKSFYQPCAQKEKDPLIMGMYRRGNRYNIHELH